LWKNHWEELSREVNRSGRTTEVFERENSSSLWYTHTFIWMRVTVAPAQKSRQFSMRNSGLSGNESPALVDI
jgi:hypothetical protein